MSNKGAYAREHQLNGGPLGSRAQEMLMDQGHATGIPSSNSSLGGTSSGLGLNEIISNSVHPTASVGQRSRPKLEFDAGKPVVNNDDLAQQERLSTPAPNFVGNLLHVSQNTLHPEQFHQVGNMEMGANNECLFAAQGNVTSWGNGNYHLPIPNFTAQVQGESSSSVQLPPFPESCLQNPFGAANDVPLPSFPATDWTNNANLLQPQSSQLSIGLGLGLGVTQEMMQSRGLTGFSPGGRSSNNETLSPNIQQHQEAMGNIHRIPKREMGESSSRNVKMKITLPDYNSQQSITQGYGNPQLPGLMENTVYDPKYVQMGLPVDPHLRNFLLFRQEA